MNDQLKKRLVGAVVLVTLAVIFIPMLLDQQDPSTLPRFGSAVPDRPEFQFETLEIPLERPAEPPSVAEAVETPVAKPSATPQEPPAQPDSPEMPVAVATVEAPERLDSEPLAWAVQVGSFSREDNAFSLRDRLRNNGFAAYVEKVRRGGDTVWRVRVGPEVRHDLAEKLRDRLMKKEKLKGLVVRHPS